MQKLSRAQIQNRKGFLRQGFFCIIIFHIVCLLIRGVDSGTPIYSKTIDFKLRFLIS